MMWACLLDMSVAMCAVSFLVGYVYCNVLWELWEGSGRTLGKLWELWGSSGEIWKSFGSFGRALGALGKLWELWESSASSGGAQGALGELRESSGRALGALGKLWELWGAGGVKFLKNSSCIVLSKIISFSLCTLPENGESCGGVLSRGWGSSGRPLGALGVVWELWRSSGRGHIGFTKEN